MVNLKGIAFSTIIFAVIAIASVVIFLAIMNSIIPNFMGKSFCRVYQVILSLPLPKGLRPNIPGCSLFPATERVSLAEELSNVNILTDYLAKCWDKSQEGRGGQTFICYEIFIENVPMPFDETEVSKIIRSRGLCKKLPNNLIESTTTSTTTSSTTTTTILPTKKCPLDKLDITGVMQWNDGWPFSAYGRQSHSDDNWKVVDINAYYGSPIFAPESGSVIDFYYYSPSDISYGATIAIRGDSGTVYEMAHIIDPTITHIGQRVGMGENIGHLINLAEAMSESRNCDINLPETSRRCYKTHLHFDAFSGTYARNVEPATEGVTLSFLSTYCDLNRPVGNINPEFPKLPTINCAKITGNPNIQRCFMEKTSSTTTTTTSITTSTTLPAGTPFDCGNDNKLNWKIGIIGGQDMTVIIKYNSESGQIEVI